MSNLLRIRSPRRILRQLCLLAVLGVSFACGGGHRLVLDSSAAAAAPISWMRPELDDDASVLRRWRAAVGSPLVQYANGPVAADDRITIVSWNVALGAGDVVPLVRELQSQGHGAIVLLLQEAFRSGDDIPVAPADAAFASFLGSSDPAREIDAIAETLGFSLYYVPSMRNGAPGRHVEDRGNAILTNLRLDSLSAVELPFERQRRVAVAATVQATTASGEPWRLRVASAHLDNLGSARRGWLGAEYGRARQARGLAGALAGAEPLVLGGDFNTWFGFSDAAYRELARAYPDTRVTDTRRTFRGVLRLDHLFYEVPDEWRVEVRRGESARGSDHHPLIASVVRGPGSGVRAAGTGTRR